MREIRMVLNYSEATCDFKVDSNGIPFPSERRPLVSAKNFGFE